MENNKMTMYRRVTDNKTNHISVSDYINFVKAGANQDEVLSARAELQKGNREKYDEIKSKSKCVTGSCKIADNHSHGIKNVEEMNGLIVLDIDENLSDIQVRRLQNDKYTYIMHKSFSGINYCVFVKIDPDKFEDSFYCLADYYFTKFGITIDQACKNKNRLRFLSYDPDIFVNEKSNKFIARNVKRFKPIDKKKTNYVFHDDDFEHILEQIQDRHIDLCQEDYFRYVSIGMSIASELGESGADKFHFICSFGSKYNEKNTTRDYKGFCKNGRGEVTIGTFYYYCKEAGIDIYTEKTKTIINRVKVAKSQGVPTVETIVKTMSAANGIDASDKDIELIKMLIESKKDFSEEANDDVSEVEQVERFIIDAFNPKYDEISNKIYINSNVLLSDTEINDIYLSCKKNFKFKVLKSDVTAIINSSAVPRINPLMSFIRENKGDYTGYIDKYIDTVNPGNEYNRWAFKKWLVGAVHNWTRSDGDLTTSPLTLVLTGRQHGTGKTSFLRHILPKELRKYFIEGQIDSSDKDSMFRMATGLVIMDDEFGGKSIKDNKAFKALSDTNVITQRRPYGTGDMHYKRRAALAGTSNEVDIIKDVTGNRRILPIQVNKGIDYDTIISFPTEKMIIEAYNLLQENFNWVVRTQEDIQYIKENTAENEYILIAEEMFFDFFSFERESHFDEEVIFNKKDLFEFLTQNTLIKIERYDIDNIIVKNKMKYGTHRIGSTVKKGFKLYKKEGIGKDSSSPAPF